MESLSRQSLKPKRKLLFEQLISRLSSKLFPKSSSQKPVIKQKLIGLTPEPIYSAPEPYLFVPESHFCVPERVFSSGAVLFRSGVIVC